jgi:hypothetical protein
MQAPKRTTVTRDALRTKAGLTFDTPVPIASDQEAIEKGRAPLPSRHKDTAALQASATQLYGPIQTIDAAFKFSPLESDADFNYLHVEPLLEQASLVLNRCREHKRRWDELQTENWRLLQELDHFFRLLPIEDREREAGADTLPYQRAILESAAAHSLQENHKQAEAQLQALLDNLAASGLNRRMSAREATAWLSAYPLKDAELRGDDAAYTFDGIRKSKPEHLFDAAHKEADQEAWEQVHSLAAAIYSAAAESEAARLRKESLDLHARLLRDQITSTRDRAQIARDATWEKAAQLQLPHGLFNYQEQTAALQRDFSADLRHAVACLHAAARGLKEIYDFPTPLPNEGTPGYFTAVLAWVSAAQNRLAQLSRLEQNYTLALSLKDLTKANWEAGLASSAWTFDLPAETFPAQSCVRLRGLALAVVGADADPAPKSREQAPVKAQGFWSARLSLPAKAGTPKELDQKHLPACHLGRVADRNTREPEIAGVQALHNASPIGQQWKLNLSPKSTAGTPTAALQDVEIYLHLAVRA